MIDRIKQKERMLILGQKALDMAFTAAAFVAAYFIRKYVLVGTTGNISYLPNYYLILLLVVISYLFVSDWVGLHDPEHPRDLFYQAVLITKMTLLLLTITAMAIYFLRLERVSRLMMATFFVLEVVFLVISRFWASAIMRRYQQRGIGVSKILVVGSRERARQTIENIAHHPSVIGYQVVGCLDDDQDLVGEPVSNGVEVIGVFQDILGIVLGRNVDIVVFAKPLTEIKDAGNLMRGLETIGVQTYIIPDWYVHAMHYQPEIAQINFQPFMGNYALTLVTTSRRIAQLVVKSLIDYVLAGLTFLVFSPLLILIAITILIFSPGPVLFKQTRSGLRGRLFTMLKFRTMVPGAEKKQEEIKALNEADGPAFKIANDPRIIPYVGTFLRRSSLDELPQLVNIIRGEMSIVGPRPPVPQEVAQYDLYQRRRLSMKPGLTCLWQIAPDRNQLSFESWMKLDLKYIDEWSLGLDFRIILRTFRSVVAGYGR